MISIEKCRELISDGQKYTDEQIVEIRKNLYQLAELSLEQFFEDIAKKDSKQLTENNPTPAESAPNPEF